MKIDSIKFGPAKTSTGGGRFLKPKTGQQFVFEFQGFGEYPNYTRDGMEQRAEVVMLDTGEFAILPGWGALKALYKQFDMTKGHVYRLTIGPKGPDQLDPWECTLEAAI